MIAGVVFSGMILISAQIADYANLSAAKILLSLKQISHEYRKMAWSSIREPFLYRVTLSPQKTFAFHKDVFLYEPQRFPIYARNMILEQQLNERNIPLETSEEGEPTLDTARWRLQAPPMERYISPLKVIILNKSKILDAPTWGLSKESWEKRKKLEEILNNLLRYG